MAKVTPLRINAYQPHCGMEKRPTRKGHGEGHEERGGDGTPEAGVGEQRHGRPPTRTDS